MARGLGITECITSPTYTIVCEYPFILNGQTVSLYHIDAYRLGGDTDFETTGVSELFDRGGITAIEWSERIPGSVPPGSIIADIEITGPDSRIIRFTQGT